MLRIVLFQPEIPPNTGNIIRLCANTGCSLHLIEPLGFSLDDKRMRRAGLDYREYADLQLYPCLEAFLEQTGRPRLYAATTRAAKSYHQVSYSAGDAILFGPETRGLPTQLIESLGEDGTIRIPMLPVSRSLNLSNAVAIVTYEALRQQNFTGLR
jgi:tRNA (cytidine/uridine-2'-O-)-methyltransferase